MLERVIPGIFDIICAGDSQPRVLGELGQQVFNVIPLEGNIAINVEGKEHRLQAGDGFRFASTRRHSFWNIGSGTARVLWVNARPKAAKPVRKANARTTPSSRR